MLIIKAILCFLVLIVFPIILGLLLTKFMKEKKNLLWAFVLGYLLEFAILQLLAIPMIFLKVKFTTLLYSWCAIIGLLTIVSLILKRKEWKLRDFQKLFQLKPDILTIITVFLIGMQILFSIRYTHLDEDDAFYVATANVTITENSMYIVAAEDGTYYNGFPTRYVFSPFPLYTAMLSSILNIHPTIVAHTVFPPLFIAMAYSIYWLMGMRLFEKDKKNTSLFLCFLSIIYMWGNFSIYTNFSFLLFRIWQGKAILANIILPSIWLVFFSCMEESKRVNWITLFIAMLASCLVSSMGIALAPITLAGLAFVFAIQQRRISHLLKAGICIVPNIIYGILYLVIK